MNNSLQNAPYLHADQPDGNGPLNVTPEREALIERLAAESRAKQQDRFEMPTWPPPEHPIVSAARILADALDRQTLVLHSSLRDLADAGFDVARATNSAKASGRRG